MGDSKRWLMRGNYGNEDRGEDRAIERQMEDEYEATEERLIREQVKQQTLSLCRWIAPAEARKALDVESQEALASTIVCRGLVKSQAPVFMVDAMGDRCALTMTELNDC